MTVLDIAISQTHPKMAPLNLIQQLNYSAKKYIFSATASSFLGKFISECPDLIMENYQFAIPPHETMYIEYNIEEMIKTLNVDHPILVAPDRDLNVGYLIHQGMIFQCSTDVQHLSYHISPIIYGLNKKPIGYRMDLSDWNKLALILGSTIHSLSNEEIRQDILHNLFIHSYINFDSDILKNILNTTLGDMRTLWAMLLLINQQKELVIKNMPRTISISKGKRTVYMQHNIVDIKINDTRIWRKLINSSYAHRQSPRRHVVRGHFRHFHLGKECVHKWGILPDKEDRWTCSECGGKRAWVLETERGDASKGYVTKTYHVEE